MKIVRTYGVPHGVCFDTWIDYIMFNRVSLPISSNICNFVFMLEHLKSFLPSWNTYFLFIVTCSHCAGQWDARVCFS